MHMLFTRARTVQMLLLAVIMGLSTPGLRAQSHEAATVIELEGQVSVMRSGLEPLFQKDTPGVQAKQWSVRAKEEIVTGPDGHAVFQISDGSTFEVFPSSRVTFQGEFSFQDMLQLFLGRIRVAIEHRNGPNHKKVQTPTAVISVRGTIFDVAVEDDDGTTFVSVEEGQVLVQHRLQPGDASILNQYDTLRIYANQSLKKAAAQGPPLKFIFDRLKNAAADVILNNPGGVIPGGGSRPPVSTGQGDNGKGTKKPPPTTAPAPGGGN